LDGQIGDEPDVPTLRARIKLLIDRFI